MKIILSLATLLAFPALALQSTQCSSTDGGIRRVEREVWGANPVYYVVNGQQNLLQDLVLKESNLKILENTGTPEGPRGQRVVYRVDVELSRKDGGMVGPGPNGQEIALVVVKGRLICESVINNARD